jgi:4-hydroxy-2-oxoheptanedioate aldolase
MFTHAAGALGADYKARADADTLVAVQIEHPDAVRDIAAIADVDGVDILFVRLPCARG